MANALDHLASVGYELSVGSSDSPAPLDHCHNIEVEDWKNLDSLYQNSWVDFDTDGTATPPVERGRYLLDPMGFVVSYGTIKNGTTTNDTILWQFPKGYRPRRQVVCLGVGAAAFTRIDVRANGDVVGRFGLDASNTSWFIYFEADRDVYVANRP